MESPIEKNPKSTPGFKPSTHIIWCGHSPPSGSSAATLWPAQNLQLEATCLWRTTDLQQLLKTSSVRGPEFIQSVYIQFKLPPTGCLTSPRNVARLEK